jgi:hypothetical protein
VDLQNCFANLVDVQLVFEIRGVAVSAAGLVELQIYFRKFNNLPHFGDPALPHLHLEPTINLMLFCQSEN